MNARTYAVVCAIIFATVALLHVLRLLMKWSVTIDGYAMPMWLSVVAALVAGALSVLGFRVVQQIQRFFT